MEKNAYIIGGVLLALLLVVAVLMVYGPVPREVQLTAADNGSEIELKKGQALVITLKANPTTGYTWDVVEPRDEQVLRSGGELEFKQESDVIRTVSWQNGRDHRDLPFMARPCECISGGLKSTISKEMHLVTQQMASTAFDGVGRGWVAPWRGKQSGGAVRRGCVDVG